MKQLYTIALILAGSAFSFAQTVFWTEDFGTGCNQGQLADGYTGSNGAWSVTTNTADNAANVWYVSSMEDGLEPGSCGTACMANDPSLHVGNIYIEFMGTPIAEADMGAAYNVGGITGFGFFSATDIQAESPVINCTGKTGVTLNLNYLEGGQSTLDNCVLMADYGSGWVTVQDLAKTSTGCAPQGTWTALSVALPNADGQASVKIGFHWVNNDDGAGADPSFAVDDLELTEDIATGIAADPTGADVSIIHANDRLEIALSDVDMEILIVKGYDILGQEVFSKNGSRNNSTQMDVIGLNGVLILQIETGTDVYTRKVVLR